MANKIGIIDVGGGFRGAYAAGVFDYCLDHGVTFDGVFLKNPRPQLTSLLLSIS